MRRDVVKSALAAGDETSVRAASETARERSVALPSWLLARVRRLTLAQRFMIASFVILLAGMLGVGAWVSQRIEDGIIHRSSATTALFVDSFVAPHLQELADGGMISEQEARSLDWQLGYTALGQQIVSFKVWNRDGQVAYATDRAVVGNVYPMHDRLANALDGRVAAGISNLDEEENEIERQNDERLLEIYTPVRLIGSDEVIGAAEFYQRTDDLDAELASAQRRSWLVVGGATLVMYLLLAGFVRRASDTIEQQRGELRAQVVRLTDLLEQNALLHERVARAAARTTALNERFLRRFSAELHDGPAQDLSLAVLQIDNLAARSAELPDAERAVHDLELTRDTVKRALDEVRTISAGLLLPQLGGLSLVDTIHHAARMHERRSGTKVALALGELPPSAPLATKIALYRVIQEALTNAWRHAGGTGQQVMATRDGDALRVTIVDEGPGFVVVPAGTPDGEQLGLSGMRERVESLGGELRIESAPGRGTRVHARLPLTPGTHDRETIDG